jgi:hypothetical protein
MDMKQAISDAPARGSKVGRAMIAVSLFCSTQFPPFAWFDRLHARSPEWSPHARFHLVWAGCLFMGLGLLAFPLLVSWWEREPKLRLVVTAVPLLAGLSYFVAALVVVPIVLGLPDAYVENAPMVEFSYATHFGGWAALMALSLGGYLIDRRARGARLDPLAEAAVRP